MLFGYKIPINFNMPYIAKNISDFWHRWHISLSSWLRDYLFIPLGGSRGGRWLTHRNLFLTMALGGLWHGASWSFMVWGVYHGLALIIHREYTFLRDRISWLKSFSETKLYSAMALLLTFHVVCIGWVFFRVENINSAFTVVKRMILMKPIFSTAEQGQFFVLKENMPVIVPVVLIMVALLLIQNWPVSYLNSKSFFKTLPAPLKAAFCTVLLFALITFITDDQKPIIYFQF
jgi:alginate O-acetyltransferase complex protein AlgI